VSAPNLAASGWVPAVLVTVGAALMLNFYGVPIATTAAFAAYLVLCIVLPGTLVWRAAHRGSGSFVADVAAGTAAGYAGEVLTYIPARAVGLPLLVLVWPVGVIGVFLAVPRLRRYFRGAPDAPQPPVLWSWAVAGLVALLVLWSGKFFRVHGLAWPAYATPDMDSPFHLALIGEARNHMPMTSPWVHGEPLYYHWFVYADMAATSWVTGIEPQLLLVRLSPLPMLAAFVVLVAVLARKLYGHWWTGVAAVVGTLLVLAPDPYGWQPNYFTTYFAFSPFEDGSSLRLQLWSSPTQTFGALLFVPVVILLVDLLRGHGRGLRTWALFVGLSGAVMGAKATFLPLLLAGVLVVVTVQFLVHRRLHVPAVMAAASTLACLLFAQAVLFGGASQGLGWQPLAAMRGAAAAVSAGFEPDGRPWRLGLLVLLTIGCWVCMWAGCAGLLPRRRLLAPEILLLLGIGVAGLGAVTLLSQGGGSQSYFLQSARPYLALAAVGGLAALLGDRSLGWRRGVSLAGAALAGILIMKIVRDAGAAATPSEANSGGPAGLAAALVRPYLAAAGAVVTVVVVAVVVVTALVRSGRWRAGTSRGMSGALVVCLLAGLCMATAYSNVARMLHESSARGWRDASALQPIVTGGTLEAGRWLRDHSHPDDLVATNVHCLAGAATECLNLHFSVAAFTERRVLVEGWGFTAKAHDRARDLGVPVGSVPFWKPELLAANDAAFTAASAATLGELRIRYGVTWLFVDETRSPVSPRLADFAVFRYRSGDCAVYELVDVMAGSSRSVSSAGR
jgi:hypothetical protein